MTLEKQSADQGAPLPGGTLWLAFPFLVFVGAYALYLGLGGGGGVMATAGAVMLAVGLAGCAFIVLLLLREFRGPGPAGAWRD